MDRKSNANINTCIPDLATPGYNCEIFTKLPVRRAMISHGPMQSLYTCILLWSLGVCLMSAAVCTGTHYPVATYCVHAPVSAHV